MINKIKDSICLVQCGNKSGTAFLLNNKTAITAYHVIADHEVASINLKFTSIGETCEAEYVVSDAKYKRLDIALLSLKKGVSVQTFLKPAIKSLELKQQWCSRGYPIAKQMHGENFISNDNIINQIFDSPEDKFDIQLDLGLKFDSYEGLSGAPLIVDGHAVGLINTQLNQNGTTRELYALSVRYFEDLLVNNGILVTKIANVSSAATQNEQAKGAVQSGEKNITINLLLIRRLMEAIGKADDSARDSLMLAEQADVNWERRWKFNLKAREFINKSFFAIFGIPKLVAIGEDVPLMKDVVILRKYLECAALITKRVLRFSCFILLSELWNVKEGNNVIYAENQRRILTGFFDDEFNAEISSDFDLLESLLNIFHSNNLIYPIAELAGLKESVSNQDSFYCAVQYMQNLDDLGRGLPTFEYCCEVEDNLSIFLSHFWFLVRYNMVSVKGLMYDEMYKSEKYFIHRYYQLVPNNNSQKGDKKACGSDAITTDSVVIYDEDFQKGINLFPFLIDINAFKSVDQSKIYFYNRPDDGGDCLNYSFIEDPNDIESIIRNQIDVSVGLNTILENMEMYPKYKLDKVNTLFQLARNTILS